MDGLTPWNICSGTSNNRTTPAGDPVPANTHEAHLTLMRVLAVRTAELHCALARPTRDAAFRRSRSPAPTWTAIVSVPQMRQTTRLLLAANQNRYPRRIASERMRCWHTARAGYCSGWKNIARPAGLEDPDPRRLPLGQCC